jgi:hypothetical protein
MRVLERGVVARVVDGLRERVAPVWSSRRLVLGDDAFRGVAGAGGRDDVLERAQKGVDEADFGSGGRKAEVSILPQSYSFSSSLEGVIRRRKRGFSTLKSHWLR